MMPNLRGSYPSGPLAIAIILAVVALFAVTSTVSAWYHAERASRARAHLEAGHAAAAEGRLADAVGDYRAALLLERGDAEAEQALALALLQLGRLGESESYLIDLLQQDPVSGPLNLALARIRSASGPGGDARRLYQRAIYGEWPDAQADQRLTARFELASYLRTFGGREELLAELLRVEAELPPEQTAAARRLADLFLAAGDRDEAVAVLRGAAERQPQDVELLTHLATTEIDAGLPAEARATLQRALELSRDRDDLRAQLTVLDRVLALDPTLPRLRLTARARRARDLLAAVVAQTAACDAGGGATAGIRRAAGTRLGRRASLTADAADEDMAMAAALWPAAAGCRAAGSEAEAISQVIDAIRRSETGA